MAKKSIFSVLAQRAAIPQPPIVPSLFNETMTGRFNRLIARLHVAKGAGAPAPQISPEISHNIILENDRPEHRYLAGDILWAIQGQVAAGATFFGSVGMNNPLGSGVLCVLMGGQLFASASVSFIGALNPTDTFGAFSALGVWPLDGRFLNKQQAVALVTQNGKATATVATRTIDRVDFVAGTTSGSPLNSKPIVLMPGDFLHYVAQTANLTLNAVFFGYFRAIEPSET